MEDEDRAEAPQPLAGLVVADFSRVLSGPLATMVLGDLGAEVIKVERPTGGDDTRFWGPPFVDGESAYFLAVNRNKRSVALDLKNAQGRDAALELIGQADVVVENFRPGTMERHGLGYEELRGDQPDLIYCSISGFGSGPGASLPGYDFLAQALGGLMSITGPENEEPTKVGVAVVDVIAGLYASIGILAALQQRERSGHGQRIEINLLSCVLSALVNQASTFVLTGQVPSRLGNQHPSIAPYETLATADGPLVVAVGTNEQFARLCRVLGRPRLADDPRFATNPDRVEHRDELREALEAELGEATRADWLDRLEGTGIACGGVNGIDEAFELAERLELDPVVTLPGQDGTPIRQVANPLLFSGAGVRYVHSPPRLGEHSKEILEWLGARP